MDAIVATVPIATEVLKTLEDSDFDVAAHIKARLCERMPELIAEAIAKGKEEERLMIYGDPTAPKPQGLIIAAEAT